MREPEIEAWLTRQRGLIAVWQLTELGYSRRVVDRAVRPLRRVHDGVYVSGHAPLTNWQTWRAATLSAPETFLSDWSNATFCGMRERRDRFPTTVVRSGSGRIVTTRRSPGLASTIRMRRSAMLEGATRVVDGIPALTPGRTLLDLAGRCDRRALDRMVRNALRLRLVTAGELHGQLASRPGARGIVALRELAAEYAALPLAATRSDAEALALAILEGAGVQRPAVKVVVAGFEADLIWWNWKLIIELDGPQWHRFAARDAQRTAAWRAAGFTVERISTDLVYADPATLLRVARPPSTDFVR